MNCLFYEKWKNHHSASRQKNYPKPPKVPDFPGKHVFPNRVVHVKIPSNIEIILKLLKERLDHS